MYKSVREYVHVSTGVCCGQRHQTSPEMELQAAVCCLILVLELNSGPL